MSEEVRRYISIDRHRISENNRTGRSDPVIVVEYEDNRPEEHFDEIWISGPSTVVYRPEEAKNDGDPQSSAWIQVEPHTQLRCSRFLTHAGILTEHVNFR